MTATSDKTAIDLNLDTLAKEAHEEPFNVVLGGKPFRMTHAGMIDAFDLFDAMSRPEPHATLDVLRLALGKESFEAMRKAKPTFGQMQGAISGYFTHCGMTAGNQ